MVVLLLKYAAGVARLHGARRVHRSEAATVMLLLLIALQAGELW